jgi:hypothetical protein
MAYSDYWKYTISIPEDLEENCKCILDNKVLMLGDSMFVFTLTDELLPYIKENFKSINGVHITPFMLEKGMNPFENNLKGLVDWMIYDDETKKFVDNLLVIAPNSDIYNKAFPICDKQVYITKWDKRWPEGKAACLQGELSMLNGSFSVSSNYYYWITFSNTIKIIYTTSDVKPPGYDPMNPDQSPETFIYDGDMYVKDIKGELNQAEAFRSTLSGYSDIPQATWSKKFHLHVLTFNMKKMFSSRVGSFSTGAELGTEVLTVTYKSRPDETGIPID